MIIDRNAHQPEYRISPNFEWREFTCKCGGCGDQHLHPDLFPKLERLRQDLGGAAIIITSGYRCPVHNAAVQGAPRSRHLLGEAADIKVVNRTPAEVARTAVAVGFTGVKTYHTWTHVDVRDGDPWFDID